MARKYELKRRAERQAETRRRIVEAAIELHRTKGPARTTLSDIAREAGVQRHTLYRHFPDERAILLACSALDLARNPLPDASRWYEIAAAGARLRRGLGELYEVFERNGDMLASVVRDAEIHPPTRETLELRAGEQMGAIRAALAEPLEGPRSLAMLDVALDVRSWRRLHGSGLSRQQAVETMVAAILAQ